MIITTEAIKQLKQLKTLELDHWDNELSKISSLGCVA